MYKGIWLLGTLLLLGLLCCILLAQGECKNMRIAVPKNGSPKVIWDISKLRAPVIRGKLISEIFADEARSKDGKAVELDNPVIFYYGVGVITKITGKKGTGELVNGELKNLKVWGHTHVERRATDASTNANTDVE